MNEFKIIFNFICTSILMWHSADSANHALENSRKNLQILSNQPEVEWQTVAYAKSFPPSTVMRVLTKLHLIRNICHWSRKQKIAFCEQVLQNDFLGFEFDLLDWDPSCAGQTYALEFIPEEAAVIRKVPMYSCPRVTYRNIETDEKEFLNYTFDVSKGKSRKTAIIYVRKGFQMRFPLYFVTKISSTGLISKNKATSPSSSRPNRKILISTKTFDSIREYLEAKQLAEPYKKFTHLFSSMNICGLRRSHKIHLCAYHLVKLHVNVELDTEGYDGNRCTRFDANTAHGLGLTENSDRGVAKNSLSLLRCPPTVIKFDRHTPLEIQRMTLYYIANDIRPDFATLFGQKIGQKLELHPESSEKILTRQKLEEDIRRSRFLPYPSASERILHFSRIMLTNSERERQINAVMSRPTVQRPSTIARNQRWFEQRNFETNRPQKQQNLWFVEDVLVKFSQIKSMKLAYQRFRETYLSIEICELTRYQKEVLCKDVVERKNPVNDRFFPCIRQKITLITRQSQVLKSNYFSMLLCPTHLSNRPEYQNYLTKIHLRDSAVMLKVYDAEGGFKSPVFYPDVLVTGINRFLLADKDNNNNNNKINFI